MNTNYIWWQYNLLLINVLDTDPAAGEFCWRGNVCVSLGMASTRGTDLGDEAFSLTDVS